MTRRCLAFLAATALTALAAPSLAQDGPPPPPAMPGPPPGWVDPQPPQYPGPYGMPADRYRPGPDEDAMDHAGAPFAHPFPPGAFPGGPSSYPPAPMGHGPMMTWGGPGPAYGYGYGYGYQSGANPAPCGCAAYTFPPVMWVPVPIETRYSYSPPVRHERDIVETHVIRESVVESKAVPAPRQTKYVKSTPRAKYTKGKEVRTTK